MANNCIHFWNINSDNYGVCRKCGTGHQFPVYEARLSERNRREIMGVLGLASYLPSDDYALVGITPNPSYEMTYRGGDK